ncbi:unnamed protein product, partial [Rotaria sp. Silwood1]
QRKTTKVGYTKKPPATKRTVQVKNCDDDDNVRSEDDQTITGKIVVQDCPCEKRFKNNATRLAALSATLDKQLRAYYQKLYNTNINYKCNVKVLSGNSTHTVFAYTVQIPKQEHTRARAAFKLLCKDEEVKKTIETASIKHEGDDDSDSSSSEDHESSGSAEKGQTLATTPTPAKKITISPLENPTQPEATQKPAVSTSAPVVTSKPTTKSGKIVKPSKPSTVDCDKDHTVIAQDDKNIQGVLVVKSCHASRFARKPSRCNHVGNKLGALLKSRLDKAGIKGQYPVNIVKTAGDKTQTEFHYTIPCDKSLHQTVIQSLKDSCKEKDFIDTVTAENQPDEDDSSSESDEESKEGPTTKVSQKEMPVPRPTKISVKPIKASKPSTVDCDKDHKVIAQDDKNIQGVLVVKSCHASRFARKPSRCNHVGDKLGALLKSRLDKAGLRGQYPVNIVKTVGDKSQTEFHYTIPCDKSQHQTVIQSLKDSCKEKDFIDTVTAENQPDEDDSSSESDEEIAILEELYSQEGTSN